MVNDARNFLGLQEIDFIPGYIKDQLEEMGITGLRKFQADGIIKGLSGVNLIVTAPTGSGKTLIGEILGVIKIVEEKKKVLYLVPYKALAEEAKDTFTRRYPFIRVGIGTGDYREVSNEKLGKIYDFMILTYEKADSIIRDSPSWIKKVGLIVVDEIHLLGDFDRGPILDMVLTRFKDRNLQIIGLSATIPNPEDIAEWLNAELIKSEERPVKLMEGIYLSRKRRIYFYDPNPKLKEIYLIESENESKDSEEKNLDYFIKTLSKQLGKKIRVTEVKTGIAKRIERSYYTDELSEQLEGLFEDKVNDGRIIVDIVEPAPIRSSRLMNAILSLTYDLFIKMQKYHTFWQILIFRKTRRLAQSTAKKIAEMLRRAKLIELFPNSTKIVNEISQKIDEPTPITEELLEYVKYGVAFHHAGLSKEERKIVENAFRDREIGVIVATPTLAAGINLPARRVVIEHSMFDRSYWSERSQISVSSYKQRSGRAGRPGLDQVGESLLIAHSEEELIDLFDKYIFGKLEEVKSYLGFNLPVLRSQVLAIIASNGRMTLDGIVNFFRNTFFYHGLKRIEDRPVLDTFESNLKHTIKELKDWNFILFDESSSSFMSTKIGLTTSKLYLDPLSAIKLVEMLHEISSGRTIDPILVFKHLNGTPDTAYYRIKAQSVIRKASLLIKKLPKHIRNKLIGEFGEDLIEVLEYYDDGFYLHLSPKEEEKIGILILVSLLILWIEEKPLNEILGDLTPSFGAGDFIELVRTIERLLHCSKELGKVMGLRRGVINRLEKLRKRVQHGVKEELIPLTQIPSVGRVRAKILYENGFRDIESLAKADVSKLSRLPTIGAATANRIINYARERVKLK